MTKATHLKGSSRRIPLGTLVLAFGLTLALATCSAKSDSQRKLPAAQAPMIPPPPTPPVQVTVAGAPAGGDWTYSYFVRNGSAFPISAVQIGWDGLRNEAELLLLPIGWDFDAGIPAGSVVSPTGWHAIFIPGAEGDSVCTLRWEATDTNHDILGGQSRTFSVKVSEPDSLYEHAHWTVYLSMEGPLYYTGPLEPEPITGVGSDIVDRLGKLKITPQPTSGPAKIRFDLPSRTPVRVEIFDVQGRLVQAMPTVDLAAGSQTVTWDGKDGTNRPAPVGMYFVRVMYGKVERFGRIVISR